MLNVSDVPQADSLSVTTRYASEPAARAKPAAPDAMILGESEAMRRLRMQVRLLGPHFRMVLLQGENGTGKRLAAEVLHRYSSHAAGPFVIYDCSRSGLSADDLADSLKAAHRGTIYLRQVHSLRRDAQAHLLETVQSRERTPPRRIVVYGLEARIVAATTEDLKVAVAAGAFSHDLYRRIASVTVTIPPLREHKEDIEAIAKGLVDGSGQQENPEVQARWKQLLHSRRDHRWPGNVEELQHVLSGLTERSGLDEGLLENAETHPAEEVPNEAVRLQQVLEQHVFQVLKQCGGNKVKAAELLGISRSTLYRMLETGLKEDKLFALR